MTEQEQFHEKTDAEVVRLVLADQSFFSVLIKRYEEKLYRYIIRLTNVTREEAEDILQNVFIKIYQNLNAFDPDFKFSSWAYRITHNEVISHHRKKNARPNPVPLEAENNLINRLASDLDLAEIMDKSFLKEKIGRVINALDDNYREILILRFFEEKDYREMSDILLKPMGTIASLVNRAKIKFKEEFKKQNVNI